MTEEILSMVNGEVFGVWFLIGAALVFWMHFKKFHPSFHRCRLQHIVTVRPDQIFAGHILKPPVNRCGGIFMAPLNDTVTVAFRSEFFLILFCRPDCLVG